MDIETEIERLIERGEKKALQDFLGLKNKGIPRCMKGCCLAPATRRGPLRRDGQWGSCDLDLCDHTGDMGPDWPGHDLPHGPSVRRANAFLGDMAWWVRY